MSSPNIGLHRNIPFADYLAWPALSSSRMGLLAKSPAHFKAGFDDEPKPSLQLGSLIHSGVLEPGAVEARYAVQPDYANDERNHTVKKGTKGAADELVRSYSAATSWCKQQADEWRRLNPGKEIVTQKQFDTLLGVAAGICENDAALEVFESGEAEVSVFWVEQVQSSSGVLVEVPCKARVDWLRDDLFVDLKSSSDASEFEWSIKQYGYGRQMAWYRRGLLKTLGVQLQPWILAVEVNRPYCSRVAPCGEDLLRAGWSECERLLKLFVDCDSANDWPGYPNPVEWGSVSSSAEVSDWFDSVAVS
jgi:hypothetical protein